MTDANCCAPAPAPYYNGLWHDDFTWPHIGLPELQKTPVMRDTIAWLTDAMVDLPVVADRIEFDGTAVMSPGGWNARPMSEEMTLHLPAAWTRLLSHADAAGIEIPRRQDWARLLERSFARVHFSFGLVWNDPAAQHRCLRLLRFHQADRPRAHDQPGDETRTRTRRRSF